MASHYLIDGYNLIYAFPEIPAGTWEEKRAYLLTYLNKHRPQGNNPVTVVYDSREGLGSREQIKSIAVIFTAGRTADEKLGEMVREAAKPRTLIVVSNDKGIHTLVRGTGA